MVIRRKVFAATPMTVDDALYYMELVGHDFYLFVDAETHRPSVVYRRKGWDYGLIGLDEHGCRTRPSRTAPPRSPARAPEHPSRRLRPGVGRPGPTPRLLAASMAMMTVCTGGSSGVRGCPTRPSHA